MDIIKIIHALQTIPSDSPPSKVLKLVFDMLTPLTSAFSKEVSASSPNASSYLFDLSHSLTYINEQAGVLTDDLIYECLGSLLEDYRDTMAEDGLSLDVLLDELGLIIKNPDLSEIIHRIYYNDIVTLDKFDDILLMSVTHTIGLLADEVVD